MSVNWNSMRLSTAAALIFLVIASAQLVSAQTGRTKAQPGADKSSAATEDEERRG